MRLLLLPRQRYPGRANGYSQNRHGCIDYGDRLRPDQPVLHSRPARSIPQGTKPNLEGKLFDIISDAPVSVQLSVVAKKVMRYARDPSVCRLVYEADQRKFLGASYKFKQAIIDDAIASERRRYVSVAAYHMRKSLEMALTPSVEWLKDMLDGPEAM